MNNSIDITIRDNLSINDLVQRQAEGFSVLRSAHVGNLSPYNMALADAGIPVLSVDHNMTGVDRNYFPGSRDSVAGSDRLASDGLIVLRVPVGEGMYLDDLHLAGVRRALPESELFTDTAYTRANEAVVGEIAQITLDVMPEQFNRVVERDGTVTRDMGACAVVNTLGILQLNDDPRAERPGVLLPNIVNMLANFVVEAMASGRCVQYHLSGPDMVNYIGRMMPELQKLYAAVTERASFGDKLPSQLSVILVPSAAARFATTRERRPKLDALLDAAAAAETELTRLNAERKDFFTSPAAQDSAAKFAQSQAFNQRAASVEQPVAERLAEVPELLTPPGQRGYVTQYDVEAEGGLYVPDTNRFSSMAALSGLYKYLQGIQKRHLR